MRTGKPIRRTIRDAIADSAKNWPGNGFTFEKRGDVNVFYSFVRIEKETASRAAALASLGLTKGDRIILSFPDPEDFVLTFLAATRLGLLAVPVFPRRLSVTLRTISNASALSRRPPPLASS